MITYEDLMYAFSKRAEDRLGAGGLLASDGGVNSAQDMPSHEAKEKADLPDAKSSKLSFGSGKVVKGPEKQKINKNVFMTRSGDSTIKQAFVSGFIDELEKDAAKEGVFWKARRAVARPLQQASSALYKKSPRVKKVVDAVEKKYGKAVRRGGLAKKIDRALERIAPTMD